MGRGPNWTHDDEQQLRALRATGATSKAIAEALGRTVPAVIARASRLGLPRRTPRPSDIERVRVTVEMPARLLPATGKSAAIREALELRARLPEFLAKMYRDTWNAGSGEGATIEDQQRSTGGCLALRDLGVKLGLRDLAAVVEG